MGIANKYNRPVFLFKTPKEFEYRSLEELFNEDSKKVHTVRAMYINHKSQFGDSPVVVTDTCLANFPNHMTDVVKEMLTDEEVIEAINKGNFGFTVYSYYPANVENLCYSVKWVDIEH